MDGAEAYYRYFRGTQYECSGRQASVLRRSVFVRMHGAGRNADLGASKIRLRRERAAPQEQGFLGTID
jgi:hypothetical protein